jgi:hypothetical protein
VRVEGKRNKLRWVFFGRTWEIDQGVRKEGEKGKDEGGGLEVVQQPVVRVVETRMSVR